MQSPTIMLIDDDNDILEVVSYLLNEAGYSVVTGRDMTALFEIEKNPPDLLLLDHWLDVKTGHDICYHLKQNPKTQDIPIILLSATMNLDRTARSCGANGYLQKPFEIPNLLSLVERHIGKQ